jgi:hypothetical protein
MMSKVSRRDFLKLSSLALGGMAFSPFQPDSIDFDDSTIVRVTTNSVSVYSGPSDENRIIGTWFRDELVHIYEEVVAEEPKYNPVWYRVWGGYMHRSRLQRVKFLYNQPLDHIPEGTRHLAEVTVPFTQPWRFTKTFGWEPLNKPPNWSTNPPIYYESVHWIDGVEKDQMAALVPHLRRPGWLLLCRRASICASSSRKNTRRQRKCREQTHPDQSDHPNPGRIRG